MYDITCHTRIEYCLVQLKLFWYVVLFTLINVAPCALHIKTDAKYCALVILKQFGRSAVLIYQENAEAEIWTKGGRH